tara:strand:+ start:338 stop:535 length:198 start_codon:yes stop_codon:yes gene_type:complete
MNVIDTSPKSPFTSPTSIQQPNYKSNHKQRLHKQLLEEYESLKLRHLALVALFHSLKRGIYFIPV